MKTKTTTRTIEVEFKTEEVLVVKRRGRSTRSWCAECDAETQLVTPERAAIVAGVRPRSIYRWIEAGRVHFTETSDGFLLVCLNSLS